MITYQVAESFVSPQGEGVYTGVPMLFIRFVGCSVGKKICNHCDTDFDRTYEWKGGGTFDLEGLRDLLHKGLKHVCLTGGEPFDRDLLPVINTFSNMKNAPLIHVETSGTVSLPFTRPTPQVWNPIDAHAKLWSNGKHYHLWVSCSPKPGFIPSEVAKADEIKVIVPGLGSGEGWPTLENALQWAETGVPVYLQPRNLKNEVNSENLANCLELVHQYPQLRISPQFHKYMKVR